MMFLPSDKWSSRYSKQFYTIEIKSYQLLETPPHEHPSSSSSSHDEPAASATPFGEDDHCAFGFCPPHKTKFPAIYYRIEIMSGTSRRFCLRRYSQFRYLCEKLDADGEKGLKKEFPPKVGPFHSDSEEFLEERMKKLHQFLRDLLARPESVGNPLIEQFLELDALTT